MHDGFWNWLTRTDAGLLVRVAAGGLFFLTLGIWDLARHGRSGKRWREYLFLLAAVAAAMLYGIINDQITVSISWEYFFYGKELAADYSTTSPPEMLWLRWEAAKIGLKATWTAGLLIGVAVLFANNPRPNRPQLPYRRIYGMIPAVFAFAAVTAVVLGLAGYFGVFAAFFREIVSEDLWRPGHFMAVWGAHLGGYIGGGLGTAWAVWRILVLRNASGRQP